MSATQRQKFHADDANQCLHNKSGSHGFQIYGRKSPIFGEIFRDKFVEKSADFVVILQGVFGANFTKKQSVKNGQFCGYFQDKFF